MRWNARCWQEVCSTAMGRKKPDSAEKLKGAVMGPRREIKTQPKNSQATRPAGMQAMGMELYQQIRQAVAELKPS